jgi:DNA-binding winged helix-turn-helix (wHTH) protein
MSLETKAVFQFGEFRADAGERRLTREGIEVSIAPKCFDALVLLLENAGKLVARSTLRQKLWDANIVEETALARLIADLRKTLGDTGSERQYLVTVPKYGYRFVAPVERVNAGTVDIATRASIPEESASPHDGALRRQVPQRAVARTAFKIVPAAIIVVALALWIGWPQRQPAAASTHEPVASAIGNRAVARQVWASLVDGKISLSTINPVYGSTLARVYGPAVSRDGRFIAFTWNDVWLHDLVTGEERHLAGQAPSDRRFECAIVSPDGKLVAYVAHSPAPLEAAELWLIGTDGSGRRRLLGGYNRILTPAWSTDGKQILASVWDKDKHDLKTALVAISDGSSSWFGEMISPRLSPDRRHIAFVRRIPSPDVHFDVYIHSVEQGTDLPLVENFGDSATPLWAPDGKSVLFVSDRNGSRDLWSIRVVEGKALGPPEMIKEKAESLLDVSSGATVITSLGHSRGTFIWREWIRRPES